MTSPDGQRIASRSGGEVVILDARGVESSTQSTEGGEHPLLNRKHWNTCYSPMGGDTDGYLITIEATLGCVITLLGQRLVQAIVRPEVI